MDNKNELIKALIEAERKFTTIERNKTGQVGNHKFKYADLTAIFNATKPGLREHGLKVIGVIQEHDNGDKMLCMTLYHVSGQFIESKVKLPSNVTKSTEFGSILTYMRRYLYSTLIGVAGEEDVEGDALDTCDEEVKQSEVKASIISEEQLHQIEELEIPNNSNFHNYIFNKFGISSYAQLPSNAFDFVYKELKKRHSMMTEQGDK